MDPRVIEKTRETLGKLIKKPPLTDKLLSKPPFRFLHDILTEVIKHTGFLEGLYSTEELVSQNVNKDRESKIKFLQKAIDVVAFTAGVPVLCRPSKVVAGHEPEKTNEFLQMMASVILQKKDSQKAVGRVLNGEKPDAATLADKKKDTTTRKKDRERERGKREDSAGKEKERGKRNDSAGKERDKGKRAEKPRKKKEDTGTSEKEKPLENGHLDPQEKPEDEGESLSALRIQRPSSAKGSRTRSAAAHGREAPSTEHENSNHVEERTAEEPERVEDPQMGEAAFSTSAHQPMVPSAPRVARPSSARPAPPRVKPSEPALDADLRISSGRERAAPVIVEDKGDESDEEEKEMFITEEALVQPDVVPLSAAFNQMNGDEDEDEDKHGKLVATLLKTRKELEQETQAIEEKPLISEAHRRKERERIGKEIEKLIGSIQGLTSSAHPLGRTMDYIQEDLDSMQKELEGWKKENTTHAKALKREEEITEVEIQPLRDQLKELDSQIAEQVDLIRGVRARLVQNDDHIRKLLSSVSTGLKQT